MPENSSTYAALPTLTEVTDMSNLRRKPQWLGGNVAHAIGTNVLLPAEIYDDISSEEPSIFNLALVVHEQTHLKRASQAGRWRWYLRYAIDPHFRFEEELAATGEQIRFLYERGHGLDLRRRARSLSGPLYLWPVSYHYALERLMQFSEAL